VVLRDNIKSFIEFKPGVSVKRVGREFLGKEKSPAP
jgi:hypothetical protein